MVHLSNLNSRVKPKTIVIIALLFCALIFSSACSGAQTTLQSTERPSDPSASSATLHPSSAPSSASSAAYTTNAQPTTTNIKPIGPLVLTIRSGKNTVYAEPNPLWSHNLKTNVAADFMRRTPQEMASQIPYLVIDEGRDTMAPFIPTLKGEEVFGQYAIYDENYNQIHFFEPSGLVPQTYLLANAKPGKHVVSLTLTIETTEAKAGYQYFFGIIIQEKQAGPTPTASSGSSPDPIGAYLVAIDHLLTYKKITAPPYKYLAIDTTAIPNLTDADKARLFKGLERTNLQLLDKTLDQLRAEGYIVKQWNFTDGAAIGLKDIRINGTVITLDASIHLHALNAYGLDDFDISWLGNRWEITRTYMTWVS